MKEYIIENEKFTEIYEKVENIYSALAIIKHYCNDNRTSEDISVIYPTLKYTFRESDRLFAYFIHKKYADKNEKFTFNI